MSRLYSKSNEELRKVLVKTFDAITRSAETKADRLSETNFMDPLTERTGIAYREYLLVTIQEASRLLEQLNRVTEAGYVVVHNSANAENPTFPYKEMEN